MVRIRTALASVSDKTGLAEFARRLAGMGVEILSTGGTAHLLRDNGVEFVEVSDYTGFPNILGGLLKTLHPKVHAGVLARRDDDAHLKELEKHGIRAIDMVIVNLYAPSQIVSQPGFHLVSTVEEIDTAGSTLIRAAAKNYSHVAVLTSPDAYDATADEMEAHDGALTPETLFDLAMQAFRHTSHYDTSVARYLAGIEAGRARGPERLTLEFVKKADLRSGDRPGRTAAFFAQNPVQVPSVGAAEQVRGPAPSFDNICDADRAMALVREFDGPAAVAVKHDIPCGAAVADRLADACLNACRGDPAGASGCAMVLNRPLDVDAAAALVESCAGVDPVPCPIELLAAPGFDEEAFEVLDRGAEWFARTCVLETGPLGRRGSDQRPRDLRYVSGGLLVQEPDPLWLDDSMRVAAGAPLDDDVAADLRFAWLCCRRARSVAAVLVAGRTLVGVGTGQVGPADAIAVAARKAGHRGEGAVLATDACLRSPRLIEQVASAGVRAIIQPADGDEAVAEAAASLGVAIVFAGAPRPSP